MTLPKRNISKVSRHDSEIGWTPSPSLRTCARSWGVVETVAVIVKPYLGQDWCIYPDRLVAMLMASILTGQLSEWNKVLIVLFWRLFIYNFIIDYLFEYIFFVNFHTITGPFMRSKIPYLPAYSVFISQIMRYARDCVSNEFMLYSEGGATFQ